MRSNLACSVATAALLAAACSGPTPGADQFPANLAISPNVGYSTDAVAVVISGTGFLSKAAQPSGGGDPKLDTRHRAWLGTTELSVVWNDTTSLDATVPAGLEPGTYDLTVENAVGNRGELKAAYTVLPTPAFAIAASANRSTVNIGQSFTLTATVTNGTSSDITTFGIVGPQIVSSDGNGGSASCSGPDPVAPATIRGGSSPVTLKWTCVAAATKPTAVITLALTGSGVDSLSGKPVTATLASPVTVSIQRPAALTATWVEPPSVQTVGHAVTMTLKLANVSGGATAKVTAVTTSVDPSTNITCTPTTPAPSASSPVGVVGGASQTFTWTCTATRFGTYVLGATVAASDANDEKPVAPTVSTVSVTYTTNIVLTVSAAAGNGSGTVSSTPAGINNCGAPTNGVCSATFKSQTIVTLAATAAQGSTFTSWSDNCTPLQSNPRQCTVTIDDVKTVTATFALQTFTVSVDATGTGSGTVASSPAGISGCAAAGGGTCSASFNYGTAVTLTASPGAGSAVSWTGCTGSGNTCTVNVTAARNVTATFTLGSRTLTVNTAGTGIGTVTCNGGACTSSYPYGTVLDLAAGPAASSTFAGWSGDCAGAGTCRVTMTADHSVTAAFTLQALTVSVAATGTGSGSVASSPAGISGCAVGGGGTCSASFNYGTPVTLTASPDAGTTVSWTGCDGSSGNTCTLNALTGAKDVTATFTLGSRNLSVSTAGTGSGTVTCNGVACASSYPYGTVVDLVAEPGFLSIFGGWSGDCAGSGACSVTMTQDHSVTADFNSL